MTPAEALSIAEQHVDEGRVIDLEAFRESRHGYFFGIMWEKPPRPGDDNYGIAGGLLGIWVDRRTGEVEELGSGADVDYSLEAFDRDLHRPMDVTVVTVGDRKRAAKALLGLHMTYVIPEFAYGETWRIAKEYTVQDFMLAFDSLPVRFEKHVLFCCMEAIESLAKKPDLTVVIEPHVGQ
jgi:hypothetical protein